jgi:hypothetical protein
MKINNPSTDPTTGGDHRTEHSSGALSMNGGTKITGTPATCHAR